MQSVKQEEEEEASPRLKRQKTKCKFTEAVEALEEVHGPVKRGGESEMTVLDSLVRTILSQNTTDKTSARAFANLKEKFPDWQEVLDAPKGAVEETIRCGGLADIKMGRIRSILEQLLPDLSLEWLRNESDEKIHSFLGAMKGVGPKTISCVLLFALGREDFPVDTHVWNIAKRLKWIPTSASREAAYTILNAQVPSHLKFSLHVLLVQHGKVCPRCAKQSTSKSSKKKTKPTSSHRAQNESLTPCPLSFLI